MSSNSSLAGVDVVVLAGGLGTRISTVLKDTPKLLAPVAGRPFLDRMVEWVAGYGATRFVLCLGHLADKVTEYLAANPYPGIEITCVVEQTPQGTAGALRLAEPEIKSDLALVMNGDSWLKADLGAFVDWHRQSGCPASLIAVHVADAGRYGALDISEDSRVLAFREKDPATGAGPINGGVYAVSRAFWPLLARFPGPSIERDVFQRLPAGTLGAYDAGGVPFIDIGTPESLAAAAAVISDGART